MASSTYPTKPLLLSLLLITFLYSPLAHAQADETTISLVSDGLDWQSAMSLYEDEEFGESDSDDSEVGIGRRSLFWRTIRYYYISYGALSANRIPCPPRSGRSYYTHNCYRARRPVNPYTRGCSAITRCRR